MAQIEILTCSPIIINALGHRKPIKWSVKTRVFRGIRKSNAIFIALVIHTKTGITRPVIPESQTTRITILIPSMILVYVFDSVSRMLLKWSRDIEPCNIRSVNHEVITHI